MGLKSVYCCPSYAGRWTSPWSPRTYGMNSFLREPPDVSFPACLSILTGIATTRIKAPCRTILLYEGVPADSTNRRLGEGYVYRCGDWQWVRGYARRLHWQQADKPWHDGRDNYLMSDGHVMTMEPEKYPEFRRGPTSPENNLWYARKHR